MEPRTLNGQSVGMGVAFGRAFVSHEGMDEITSRPLRDEEVAGELARLDSVARAARVSLVHQRDDLATHFTEDQRRIFDAHLKILEDPVIESDVRSRISKERMNLEGAVRDVLGVYEQLFQVVETEGLRNKLSDLRDVVLRLLKHCHRENPQEKSQRMEGGVLVVPELSVSDLAEALQQGAVAIVAEDGSLGSHGAILTRASGIPALLGVEDITDLIQEGDTLLVDGDHGQLILNPPDEMVMAATGRPPEVEAEALPPAILADGETIHLEAAAASPRETRRAVGIGVSRVGLYRTELPVLQRAGAPREDSLTKLYGQVVQSADMVRFRLPDLESTAGLEALYPGPEANPSLGLRGCRLLFEHPDLMQRQIRAMMKASVGKEVRIAIPFVNDTADVRRVREACDNQRETLRLEGLDVSHPVQLGVVIETPSAALLGRELLAEADFALIGLDSLSELLLAADASHRDPEVGLRATKPHPVVLRAVRKLASLANGLNTELSVYGEGLADGGPLLPLLLGVGIRRLIVRPESLREVHARLAELGLDACERQAEAACHASTADELA
ncbi:MAG: PEP-utilizing enzyme [Planctomycetota bacterium]|nr:PEP-utilizing enzyme [Planctomycetota bacterium]